MKISTKLMMIVILTVVGISLTLWSVFEIAKGATFHQLNFLHLKYNAEFSQSVANLKTPHDINLAELRTIIHKVRDQPVACVNEVNVVNRFIMKQIDTYSVLLLCEKDIIDADNALASIDAFEAEKISFATLQQNLADTVRSFNQNSVLFEQPVAKTVSFITSTMVPLVVFISIVNVVFISFFSRNITNSINGLIRLLREGHSKQDLQREIDLKVSGELKTLMQAARERLTSELLVTEINQQLESLVAERTKSLTRANEELAQFAYRASHDLKGPLTSSKSLAKFVQQDILAGHYDNAANDTGRIIQQMEKLETLVTDILSLTAADNNSQEIGVINFSLILDNIYSRVADILKGHQCALKRDISVSEDFYSQEVRLTQILENLIMNSIKYSNPDNTDSFVSVSIVQNEAELIIMVSDNGIGIPADRQHELFHMFKRFHPKVSSGSGLGMAIVKKHVDFLGAKIAVDSSENGTNICITFGSKE